MALYNLTSISRDIRHAIFEAQNWRCCYCGFRMRAVEPWECEARYARLFGYPYQPGAAAVRQFLHRSLATIEHLHRRADGGSDYYDNLAGACNWCNSNRMDRSAMEWFNEVQMMVAFGQHPFSLLIKKLYPRM
jgi:hypothetical protein